MNAVDFVGFVLDIQAVMKETSPGFIMSFTFTVRTDL